MPLPPPSPSPRAALEAQIANRRAQLEEELRHFKATAKVTTVPTEKAEAEARSTIAETLLKALESL